MTLSNSLIGQLLRRGLGALLPAASPTGEQEYKLARLLQLSPAQLAEVRLGPRYHYRPFSLTKPDGRERRILAPSPALKALQRQLLRNYLSHLPIHPASTAFRSGGSIVSNAQKHLGQGVIATVDLADFFESTSAERVRAFFVKEGWRGQALAVLMRLCVYRNGLPQGAPTSPCLSNLVNIDLDRALSELARQAGACYSRYGDDLAFSWRAAEPPAYFEVAVGNCLRLFDYAVQPAKAWQVFPAAAEPQIAGVVLGRDGRLQASPQVRARARKLRWQWWWTRDALTAIKLQGYNAFFKMLGLK